MMLGVGAFSTVALSSIFSGQAFAQEHAPLTQEQIRSVMDEAMVRANSQREQKLDLPLPLPANKPPQAVPNPTEIAEKINQEYRQQAQIPTEDLLIFVSTSMPAETLKLLGEQAARAGGVLVLRGFKGGLQKGALQETIKAMKPVMDSNATVQIDPESFQRFGISAVPSFVIAVPVPDCQPEPQNKCQVQAAVLSGDVSLDYALDHWVSRGGRAGQIAQRFLARMQGSNQLITSD